MWVRDQICDRGEQHEKWFSHIGFWLIEEDDSQVVVLLYSFEIGPVKRSLLIDVEQSFSETC